MSVKTITVVGAIIRRGDEVLTCRRRADKSAGGLWEFPGGKIEEGESAEAALSREIHEELGVSITVGALASRHTTPLEGRLIDLACYWAELDDAAPEQSTDHDLMAWRPLAELQGLEWSPADVPIINDIVRALPQQ
ncbi:(deoxy)nucleoside triphosphate pyrophosphohydrolase [Pseudoclavibacter albus]|uniref:(deoxy)nucleoside triphosphate pyrophosphohydrolase n=1 Tax=Pseudoclavibacter albus TaxID=272241 RepID=UPI0008260301|nr:(deoxy)nucleoside triphosphate pyrophosphohydrolase [Pseudoclavibacter alba]